MNRYCCVVLFFFAIITDKLNAKSTNYEICDEINQGTLQDNIETIKINAGKIGLEIIDQIINSDSVPLFCYSIKYVLHHLTIRFDDFEEILKAKKMNLVSEKSSSRTFDTISKILAWLSEAELDLKNFYFKKRTYTTSNSSSFSPAYS